LHAERVRMSVRLRTHIRVSARTCARVAEHWAELLVETLCELGAAACRTQSWGTTKQALLSMHLLATLAPAGDIARRLTHVRCAALGACVALRGGCVGCRIASRASAPVTATGPLGSFVLWSALCAGRKRAHPRARGTARHGTARRGVQ
jgi:hypothetical protein